MTSIRIGQKLISKERIYRVIDNLLTLRSEGLSQQELADQMKIDRAFISKIESLGEIRKGKSVAVIGFPIANKIEVINVLKQAGVDDWLILNERERLRFVRVKTGKKLMDNLMELITRYRKYEVLIALASDQRIKLIRALTDSEVLSLELGRSPLTADQQVPIDQLKDLLLSLDLFVEESNYCERRKGII